MKCNPTPALITAQKCWVCEKQQHWKTFLKSFYMLKGVSPWLIFLNPDYFPTYLHLNSKSVTLSVKKETILQIKAFITLHACKRANKAEAGGVILPPTADQTYCISQPSSILLTHLHTVSGVFCSEWALPLAEGLWWQKGSRAEECRLPLMSCWLVCTLVLMARLCTNDGRGGSEDGQWRKERRREGKMKEAAANA